VNRALAEVARLVHAESGILVKENQYRTLQAAVARASGDPETFLQSAADPAARPQAVARLIDEVTIGETFFLRDRRQLGAIDWQAASRRAGDRPIRVWSAACSTGEEPYSLALLATEALGTTLPPVRILATDIARPALEAARRGVYRARAVRDVEPGLRRRYFHEQAGSWVVDGSLSGCVEFASHNLVLDPIPPLGEAPFDLIVCRNVFIYFDTETCSRVLAALERALAPGGELVLGAADALCRTSPGLTRIADRPIAVPKRGRKRTKPRAPTATNSGIHRPARPRPLSAVPPPADARALFERGMLELEAGNPQDAIASLRQALYVDPGFGLAAFKLARAYEAAGDRVAAKRSYEQALRTLGEEHDRYESILGQVDVLDVAAVCHARLAALR
jgi:chemotaxis methyl-accepting protein methylase